MRAILGEYKERVGLKLKKAGKIFKKNGGKSGEKTIVV